MCLRREYTVSRVISIFSSSLAFVPVISVLRFHGFVTLPPAAPSGAASSRFRMQFPPHDSRIVSKPGGGANEFPRPHHISDRCGREFATCVFDNNQTWMHQVLFFHVNRCPNTMLGREDIPRHGVSCPMNGHSFPAAARFRNIGDFCGKHG